MKVYKVGDRVQIQPLASDREKYGHPRGKYNGQYVTIF